jgi:hypothetical protein
MAPNLNNSVQAVITRFMINRTRSQVKVALTSAKNRTYFTRWLHVGCEPKLLPLIHTYSNQTVNTTVVRVWNPMKIFMRKSFSPDRINLLWPTPSHLRVNVSKLMLEQKQSIPYA